MRYKYPISLLIAKNHIRAYLLAKRVITFSYIIMYSVDVEKNRNGQDNLDSIRTDTTL